MKVVRSLFLVLGFILVLMAGIGGLIIADLGPGSLERAVGLLASATAGGSLTIAAAMLRNHS